MPFPTVLWSCVARNDTILAEVGEDTFDGSVSSTARELLKREPTPGWEFHKRSRVGPTPEVDTETKRQLLQWPVRRHQCKWRPQKLRGCKFHVYEKDTNGEYVVWVFACVYDSKTIETTVVKAFLIKLDVDTEQYRGRLDWLYGPTLACQESFGPLLRHYMMQIPYLAKIYDMKRQIEIAKIRMSRNIEMLLEKEDTLDLHQDASQLQEMAKVFKRKAKHVRRAKMWQNAKHGLYMGTTITASVAIVAIPSLIALL